MTWFRTQQQPATSPPYGAYGSYGSFGTHGGYGAAHGAYGVGGYGSKYAGGGYGGFSHHGAAGYPQAPHQDQAAASSGYSQGQGSWQRQFGGGGGLFASDLGRDYSGAISALTLLGFLFFLNLLQNQLLSSGSQTVVFTVGGGTGTNASGNGTLGRRRRETAGHDVWTRDFDMSRHDEFQRLLDEGLWVSDEESEFEMGADSGAGRPESAKLFRLPLEQETRNELRVEEDEYQEVTLLPLVTKPMQEVTLLPLVTQPMQQPRRVPLDAWERLVGVLPEGLRDYLTKCQDLVTCTFMQQHTRPSDEAACARVLLEQSEECRVLVRTLSPVVGKAQDPPPQQHDTL